jgi:class 3 adenylate cyclase/tetratricopeptide (TPR) repeat protein
MNYKPKAIDTSKVVIEPEHLKLTELLAKNTHEIWAQQRFDDGWQYGKKRNDTLKLHPCLIPYEDLPESEKEYDRLTAMGVIKTLLALGYRLEGKGIFLGEIDSEKDQELVNILQDLKKNGQINISSLLNIQRQTIKVKPGSPLIYQVLGEAILQLGEPLIAYDILAEGLKYWRDDMRLKQLMALALARSGATQKANSLLLELLHQAPIDDVETLSLLARTYKDLWQQNTPESNHKSQNLQLAAQYYQQAYEQSENVYPGINAATMTLLTGDQEKARSIATKVKQQCLQNLPPPNYLSTDNYWTLATLGEASLVLEEITEAKNYYQQACQLAEKRYGDISSTRRNTKILFTYFKQDLDLLMDWFPLPKIAVFSGHMIDLPDRPQPRFPAAMEAQVYEAIKQRLLDFDIKIGYASGACGGDILFLEAILELQGEVHVVLPYPQEQFIADSVEIIPHSNWKQRFLNLLNQATEITIASKYPPNQDKASLFHYTSLLLHGLAKMRSQQFDTPLVPIALWDGKPGDGYGGTATNVRTWQDQGYSVEIISPQNLSPRRNINTARLSPNPRLRMQGSREWGVGEKPKTDLNNAQRPIMALLFADVVHFSALTEDQIPLFIEHFLGAIASLEQEKGYEVALKNTWGDALYYVFPQIKAAGNFALEVCELVQNTDWNSKNLPDNLNLRTSLHAGPVYEYINPITGNKGYSGTHASYAARIEPITPPGKVYASREFVAIANAENIEEFSCDYVGQTPLAKNYGTFPAYHVHY